MSSASLPPRRYDPRSLFLFSPPAFLARLGRLKRPALVGLAGVLFALGWWAFVDAVLLSGKDAREQGEGPHVNFADWSSGLVATLGMLIVNLIDKQRLASDAYADGSASAWRARTVLFAGFALLAGGLTGSITTLVVKYVLAHAPPPAVLWGVQGVALNVGVMASAVVLWLAQVAGEDEYEYNINL